MNRNVLKLMIRLISSFFCTLLLFNNTYACTEVTVKATDGSVVVGRSMEFGPDLKTHIMTSTRDKAFVNKAPDGNEGLSWKSKYGYIYMNFFGAHHPVDGMNEKGLSFGYLYLPGYTQYQTITPSQDAHALSYLYLGDWILGNFTTVEQVKAAIKKIHVFAEPENMGSYKDMVFPLHAMVTDASGKSITIEFIKGKTVVYDNKNGVLTNSPPYNWQLTNLKNYANLTPYIPKEIKINGISYSGTGQGAGSVGLPGDFTPPSRFVKESFLVQNVYPAKNAVQALNLTQHIMNDVDIPDGAVRGVKDTDSLPDTTQWVVFKDLKNHILYFKSYNNLTLQSINMSQLNFAKGANELETPIETPQTIKDITAQYMKTKLH